MVDLLTEAAEDPPTLVAPAEEAPTLVAPAEDAPTLVAPAEEAPTLVAEVVAGALALTVAGVVVVAAAAVVDGLRSPRSWCPLLVPQQVWRSGRSDATATAAVPVRRIVRRPDADIESVLRHRRHGPEWRIGAGPRPPTEGPT